MQLRERTVCYRGNDVSAAYENAYYLSEAAPRMLRVRVSEIGNDIYDVCRISYSTDDGRIWGEDQPYQVSFATPAGMVRKGYGTPVAWSCSTAPIRRTGGRRNGGLRPSPVPAGATCGPTRTGPASCAR